MIEEILNFLQNVRGVEEVEVRKDEGVRLFCVEVRGKVDGRPLSMHWIFPYRKQGCTRTFFFDAMTKRIIEDWDKEFERFRVKGEIEVEV